MTIVNMPQSPVIAVALRDGTVNAVVSLETLNSVVLKNLPGALETR